MLCSSPFVDILVYHPWPWLDVARWRCVNVPDGLATYWAHALLITLQGTREETTLRAHTSVVLLYACCWSCASTLFECIRRATPQPMSAGCAHRLCWASNVLKLHIGEAVSLLCAFFSSISLPRFLTAAWGMKPLSQRTDETDQAYEDLLVVFMCILLLFTYTLVCF